VRRRYHFLARDLSKLASYFDKLSPIFSLFLVSFDVVIVSPDSQSFMKPSLLTHSSLRKLEAIILDNGFFFSYLRTPFFLAYWIEL